MPFNLPYFPFYPADFLLDGKCAIMTLEQVGAYIKLLCYQWREGNIPSSPEQIATLLGVDSQALARLKPGLLECFPGGINPRLNVERENAIKHHNQLSEFGRRGITKRFPNRLKKIAKLKPPLQPGLSISESESESEIKKEPPTPLIPKKEIPKNLELLGVKVYFAEINCPPEEAERFFDYYESKGWVVGKAPMKSWRAAARNWKRGWLEKNPKGDPNLHTCQKYNHNQPFPCGKPATKQGGLNWLCDVHYEQWQIGQKKEER